MVVLLLFFSDSEFVFSFELYYSFHFYTHSNERNDKILYENTTIYHEKLSRNEKKSTFIISCFYIYENKQMIILKKLKNEAFQKQAKQTEQQSRSPYYLYTHNYIIA